MQALELVEDRESKTPAPKRTKILLENARKNGLLVGAGGFSYEEAATICGCAVGTIKSRVGRARATLNSMLADGDIPQRSIKDATAHRAILEELDEVAAGNGIAAKT